MGRGGGRVETENWSQITRFKKLNNALDETNFPTLALISISTFILFKFDAFFGNDKNKSWNGTGTGTYLIRSQAELYVLPRNLKTIKVREVQETKKKQKRKQEHGEGTKEGPSQIICHGNQSCCCRRRLWRGLGLELLSWALMFAQHGNNKRNQKPTSTLVRKVLPLNFCECCRKEGGGGGGGNLYPNPRAQSRLRRMPKQLKLLLAKK